MWLSVASLMWTPRLDSSVRSNVEAARACGVMTIATRHVRDFRRAPVDAKTPQELLAEKVGAPRKIRPSDAQRRHPIAPPLRTPTPPLRRPT